MTLRHRIEFYALIGCELLFLPALFIYEYFKRYYCFNSSHNRRVRKPIQDTAKIYIHTHDWGGYKSIRQKSIKNAVTFYCGLEYQLKRFEAYKGQYQIESTLTMSDVALCVDLEGVKQRVNNFIEVDNLGMDFSGYSAFYASIKDKPNSYVILSNSSVNSSQDDFLDIYIDYMQTNEDVGIMGISYCTKRYQSLVRNNFTPHLQSFFYLTTIDVLRDIVASNGGVFPGEGIGYKLLLIRKGEVQVSTIALKLGYTLATVQECGKVFKFDRSTLYRDWSIPKGDIRQNINCPNKINPIK